jgi:hypothetical protein
MVKDSLSLSQGDRGGEGGVGNKTVAVFLVASCTYVISVQSEAEVFPETSLIFTVRIMWTAMRTSGLRW